MGAKTFTKKMKSIQRELLAIKTAHERGLGLANFNSKIGHAIYRVISGDYPYLKVTAQFDETVENSPYCQCYISNAQYFQPVQMGWDESAHRVVITYQCYVNNVSLEMYAKLLATKPIISVTIEEAEYV